MRNRSVVAVVLLSLVTFGLYDLYWFVSTKRELNERGAEIPTSWLLIVPFVNIYWAYKYFEGAEQVNKGRVSGILMFLLDILVIPVVPMAVCQDAYNNLQEVAPTAAQPAVAPAAPVL